MVSAIRAGWPWVVLFAVTGWTVAPIFGNAPLSHDHPTHIFQAWHFWTQMLSSGRLRGWSHYWGFGYPSGDLTPIGPDIWVALFRAATLGLLGWTTTYSVALVAMLLFAAGASYAFARRFFGVPAGLIAAFLWLFDPGAFYEGGWMWHMTYGVWPVTLGTSFVLCALVKMHEALSLDHPPKKLRRDMLWATLWVSLSLVTHQLSMVIYLIAVPFLVADCLLRDHLRSRQALGRIAAVMGLGVGLASFYVLPMLARSDLSIDLGVPGVPLDELGKRLVEFRHFDNVWAPVIVLAFLGVILTVTAFRPLPGALFFSACATACVLLSSDILVKDLHLERLTGSILKIETPRMLLVAKMFCYPLAAHALVSPFTRPGTGRFPRPHGGWIRFALRLALVAALASPLVGPIVSNVYKTQVAKQVQTGGSTTYWRDLQSLFQWSAAERRATTAHYRIAYALPMHDHLSTIAPVFDDTFIYKVGYTPAQSFNSFPMTGETELLRALSVKYFVTDHPIADPTFKFSRTFGQLYVYEFAQYQSEPFTLLGQGQVEVRRFAPEVIHLRLQNVAPGARLILHVAKYPLWKATLNGKELPITQAPVYGAEYPILMEVPAGNGELVFRYVRRTVDWVGELLSLFSLVVAAAILLRRVPAAITRLFRKHASSVSGRFSSRGVLFACAIVALVALGAVGARLSHPRPLAPDSAFNFASDGGSMSLDGQACAPLEQAGWQCGSHQIRQEVVSGIYGSHLCFSAPTAGSLVVASRRTIGRFVAGRYDPRDGEGRISVAIDGTPVGEMSTRGIEQGQQFIQFDTRRWEGQRAALRIEASGAPLHCLDFRLLQ